MLYVNPVLNQGAEALDSPARRRLALKEFEQLYLREMLKSMRQTLPEGGLFEKSQQQEYFREMLDDALAGKMAESGQFGLAAQMETQLAQQEAALKSRGARAAIGVGLPLSPLDPGLPLKAGREAAGGLAIPWPAAGLPLPAEDLPANVQRFLEEADNKSVR